MIERIIQTPEFFLACVGLMIWLVRLEGKLRYTEDSLTKLEVKHDALDNKIVEKLSLIEKSLARLEGRLNVTSKEEG